MRRKCLLSAKVKFYFFVFFIFASISNAAPLFNFPIELKQPDGTVLNVFTSGDEYFHWVHDKENYTITRNNSGYYVYARLENGKLVPSEYIVGKTNPLSTSLIKGVNISPALVKELRESRQHIPALSKKTNSTMLSVSNLVMFIRFSDESEFTENISLYNGFFNNTSGVSLKNYYNEVSWGMENIQSYIYPESGAGVVSYKDTYPRSYFEKYDAATNKNGYPDETESANREKALLIRALNYIKTLIPSSLDLDKNNDGYIDNICFIVKGDPAGWSDLLWPHMSSFSSDDFIINGKKAYNYNFQLQNSTSVDVLCHEMGHTLGAPDLYTYDYKSNPVGEWDIMAYGQGTHMLNFLKYKYFGWITDIPEITSSDTYTINPSTSQTNNIYKIKSPRFDNEYFILEYRVKTGLYEQHLPGSGLIVYRIDTRFSGNENAPPYEIYVYRPDGTFSSDGEVSNAAFSLNSGRTAINDQTNPSSFLYDGGPGGLDISNISAAGSSMTFDVKIIDKIEGYSDPYSSQTTAYNWYDISKSGTVITNWKNGTLTDNSRMDDGYTPQAIPIGFDFKYFGTVYNSIYAGVNGLVSFTQKFLNSSAFTLDAQPDENEKGFFTNTDWPGNSVFPNSIAVAYNDFDLNKEDGYGGGKVMYQTIDNKFILSWINAGTFVNQGDTTNTFQLVLDKDAGSITLNFKKIGLADTRSEVKIGLQGTPPYGVSWVESGVPADRIPQDNSSVIFYPGGFTGVDKNITSVNNFVLNQNYPNPFNPVTTINYVIPVGTRPGVFVQLRIYDMIGREVAVLVNKEQNAGTYKVNFDAGKYNLSSGVYLYKLSAGEFNMTKKLMLLK